MLAALTLPILGAMLAIAERRAPRGPSPGMAIASLAAVTSAVFGSMAGWQRYPLVSSEVWTWRHDLAVSALVLAVIVAWNLRIAGKVRRAGHAVVQPLAAVALPAWGVPAFLAYVMVLELLRTFPRGSYGEFEWAIWWCGIGMAGASCAAIACAASLGWGVLLEGRAARSEGFADRR